MFKVYVHISKTRFCFSREILQLHKLLLFNFRRFLIGGDGNVYEGCGWTHEGAHTYGYNKKSIGIGFIGNFESKSETVVFFLTVVIN